MTKWIFFTECENNKTIGTGHLHRSITFAKYVKCMGDYVIFLVNDNSFTIELLQRNGFDYDFFTNLDSYDNFDIIFLDTYDRYKDLRLINKLKRKCSELIVISDSDVLEKVDSDLTIYTNELLSNESNNKSILAGSKYFIMDDFYVNSEIELRDKVKNILVTFGGCDPFNVTLTVMKALAEIQDLLGNIKINILIGAIYPFKTELLKFLNSFQVDYNIFQNLKSVHDLYLSSDYVITAGGNSFYELVALGVPCSVVAQTHRQDSAMKILKDIIGIDYIGYHEDVSYNDISESIVNNIFSFANRKNIHKKCLEYYSNNAKKTIFNKVKRINYAKKN